MREAFVHALKRDRVDDGDGRLTYIRDRHSFEWGRWYHVVGVYDGAVQRLYVDGGLVAEAREQSGPINYPARAAYVIGAFIDDNEKFYWRGWLGELRLFDRALDEAEVRSAYEARRGEFPERLHVAVGPYVERLARDAMRIRWRTEHPSPTRVLFGDAPAALEVREQEGLRTEHELVIDSIVPKRMYFYRIPFQDENGAQHWTRLHEYDSTYGFSELTVTPGPFAYENDEDRAFFSEVAEKILADSDVAKGYALVVGNGEGRLAYELAARTQLQVVALDDDPARIERVRRALDETGLYGVRVKVHHCDFESLPYGQYMANLIVSESMLFDGQPPCTRAELRRVLRPNGGRVLLAGPREATERLEAWRNVARDGGDWIPASAEMTEKGAADNLVWLAYTRPALPKSGEWTHQYANAANTACSEDPYPGLNMRPLWFGDPGPRPMADRGTRSPAPLYTDGRMYVQGDCRLFGMDAYNGTMLWELDIPDLRRANVPRCSSNMAVAGDTLYVAVRDRCWVIDGQTGTLRRTLQVPVPGDPRRHDWGYVAVVDDMLYGTAVKRGGLYIGADGEWYDKRGPESEKTVSDVLFVLKPSFSGKTRSQVQLGNERGEGLGNERGERGIVWSYTGGAVLDSTLTVGGGRVYFIESRNPAIAAWDAGRFGDELNVNRFLVGLDAKTGDKLWEQAYDHAPAVFVHYLMYANETLVSVTSSDRWDVYAFDARDGAFRWERHNPWNRDHHGGAMQHPAIIGDIVYAEPAMIRLASGDVIRDDVTG
ncbi:MAG TPA: PQQ-binding-like beta-propeller repeat protein, partial [Candidatus Hydrogenedentes bacterium]|nr:PQQ-binding-like beta-propeller repeat protein [Candidatus Hydrogenedentota bacterium]